MTLEEKLIELFKANLKRYGFEFTEYPNGLVSILEPRTNTAVEFESWEAALGGQEVMRVFWIGARLPGWGGWAESSLTPGLFWFVSDQDKIIRQVSETELWPETFPSW